MEGLRMCFIFLFSLVLTRTFAHHQYTHSSSLTEPDAQAWNEHERRELWLAFSHCARIYGALYTYLNEPLTIKNSPKLNWEVQWDELTQPVYHSQDYPSTITQTQTESQGCMHTVRLKWRNMTWKHNGALKQLQTTGTVYSCWSRKASSENKKKEIWNCISLSPIKTQQLGFFKWLQTRWWKKNSLTIFVWRDIYDQSKCTIATLTKSN